MKRTAEAGPSTPSKRPRPDSQLLAQVFPPYQKRKAGDICRKGSDGAGWIEGKVYQRGAPSAESWEFIITAELGSRAQVLLSGSCSEHFAGLPIAVGAQVRVRTKGLTLEVVDDPPKLLLPKRFAWREGATLYVNNPKTGEESFVDTWADCSPDALDTRAMNAEMPSTSSLPRKRRRTPNPSAQEHGGKRKSASPTPQDTHTVTASAQLSEHMLVDNAEPVDSIPEGEPVKNHATSSDSQPDPQNPQSLPSPPPELSPGRDTDEQVKAPRGPELQSIPASCEHPREQENATALSRGRKETSPTLAPPPDQPAPSPPPAMAKVAREENGRKLTSKARRKLKQLQKAGKLADGAARASASASNTREAVADDDGEEYYWDGADTIPDDVLVDDVHQQQPREEGGHAHAGEVARANTPVPEPREAAPGEEAPAASRDMERQEDESDPLESLRMGCVSGFVAYTPFTQIRSTGSRHIIGVVESSGILTRTKTQEFMLRLVLYDPTNYGTGGFSVALFEKAENGLPKVDAGDILMLRSVQIDHFNGTYTAVGASFKGWQWAVFHVKTGRLSSAPAETCALRHFQPEASEMQFSIRLGDWWRDVSSGAVSFAPDVSRIGRRVREHKLIADATDDEYFDCTVEVLHGFRNDNGVYSVFVTDYTRHPAVSPTQGEWCPLPLVPFVLRIEMWDSSAEVGPKMQAGEYYSIRNLRTRIGAGGFLEGKTQEGEKITKLDEDQLENQPRLSDLLKRKKAWAADTNPTGGAHEFPHKLIEEAEENCHFKCTVEVVHVSPKDDFTYLYVTDYTSRTDLVPVSASIAPSGLEDRVVRVELRDAQVDTAKNLETGDFVAIRNLRLRPSGGGTLLAGRLGGDQRLITKLKPRGGGNADLRALLSRKEEWTKAQSTSKREGKRTAARAARLAAAAAEASTSASGPTTVAVPRKGKPKPKVKQFATLREVKESDACPAVFRVRVRAVDFFPDDLRDCTVLRCTSCDEALPKTRRRCTKCDDVMEDETAVAAFFRLWLRVADEEGTTLDVSIADERSSVLQDLSPDDVHEDDDAFAMLVARVRPLVGGLLQVDDGEARRRPIAQDADADPAPWIDLTVGSWLPTGESDTPEARAYVVLQHSLCEDDA